MQKTVYKCDQCTKEIGRKVHISLMIQSNNPGCGIAVPPQNERGSWRVVGLPSGFVHFCNEEHMAKYFKAQIERAKEILKK